MPHTAHNFFQRWSMRYAMINVSSCDNIFTTLRGELVNWEWRMMCHLFICTVLSCFGAKFEPTAICNTGPVITLISIISSDVQKHLRKNVSWCSKGQQGWLCKYGAFYNKPHLCRKEETAVFLCCLQPISDDFVVTSKWFLCRIYDLCNRLKNKIKQNRAVSNISHTSRESAIEINTHCMFPPVIRTSLHHLELSIHTPKYACTQYTHCTQLSKTAGNTEFRKKTHTNKQTEAGLTELNVHGEKLVFRREQNPGGLFSQRSWKTHTHTHTALFLQSAIKHFWWGTHAVPSLPTRSWLDE